MGRQEHSNQGLWPLRDEGVNHWASSLSQEKFWPKVNESKMVVEEDDNDYHDCPGGKLQ